MAGSTYLVTCTTFPVSLQSVTFSSGFLFVSFYLPINNTVTMGIKKIEIDPRINVYYDGYYLLGLRLVFPDAKIVFKSQDVTNNHRVLCFNAISDNNKSKRYAIDTHDSSIIYEDILQWTNIYAKVNLEFDGVEGRNEKIVSIPPSFGIQFSGIWGSVKLALQIQFAARNISKQMRIEIVKDFFRQYKYRLPIQQYNQNKTQDNYIFFTGSLWLKESQTNAYRSNFIRACKSFPFILFEGGFAPRVKNDIQGFEEHTMKERITFPVYLEKLKRSFCVFNTPAVASCHGWKLGEFMALGKTIISTPLTRQTVPMMQPMKHYYPVDGTESSIALAIQELSENKMLAERLADNLYDYYQANGSPEAVIRNLLK